MSNEFIINSILAELEVGAIQLWQVRSRLINGNVCEYDIDRLTEQITKTYLQRKPRY